MGGGVEYKLSDERGHRTVGSSRIDRCRDALPFYSTFGAVCHLHFRSVLPFGSLLRQVGARR